MPSSFRYDSPPVPPDYVCEACGARGVRLYRGYNQFDLHLHCTACTERLQGAPLDPAKPCAIRWCVAAMPTEDLVGYWGYTSAPDAAIAWWKALPR